MISVIVIYYVNPHSSIWRQAILKNLDPGFIIVLAAMLFFYLRLILLQRQRAKEVQAAAAITAARRKGGRKNQPSSPPSPAPRYGIISPKRNNRIIGGIGLALLILGMLFNAGVFNLPLAQAYWWVPSALGIILFSWMFSL
jgi:hypothetical protein